MEIGALERLAGDPGTIDPGELSAMIADDVPTVISGLVVDRPHIGFRPAGS